MERNIIESGEVKLAERHTKDFPDNHFNLIPGSLGDNLNTGIFKKRPINKYYEN